MHPAPTHLGRFINNRRQYSNAILILCQWYFNNQHENSPRILIYLNINIQGVAVCLITSQ